VTKVKRTADDCDYSFLTDYIHTFVIAILCCYLTTKALTHHDVGSIDGLYDLVVKAQPTHAVDGNYQGSLLTMNSQQGIFFAIILLVSNFGAVIVSLAVIMECMRKLIYIDGYELLHQSVCRIAKSCCSGLCIGWICLLFHSMEPRYYHGPCSFRIRKLSRISNIPSCESLFSFQPLNFTDTYLS
jgi:hypothetical protein